jgi:uncharacterized membrane protein YgcG
MRRRHADEFAAALEGLGSRASSSDPNLVPLLNLAQQLQALPLGPTPAFRDSLRQRLVAVAAVAEPVAAPTPVDRVRTRLGGWRLQRAAQLTAAALAAVVAITGVGTASSRSVPGDRLYGLKRAAESVQLDLARNEVNRGKRELQHAATRLDEIATLAARAGAEDVEAIVGALADMDAQTRRGVQLLFDAGDEEQSAELIAHIQDFAARQQAELMALSDELPGDVAARVATSLGLLARIRATAAEELGDLAACTGVCPDVPADKERERERECDCAPEPGPVLRIPVGGPGGTGGTDGTGGAGGTGGRGGGGGTGGPGGPAGTGATAGTGTGGTAGPAPVATQPPPARVPAPAPVVTSSTAPQPTGTDEPALPLATPTVRLPQLPTTGPAPIPTVSVLPTPVASTITDLLDDLTTAPELPPTTPLPTGAVTPPPVP